MTRIKREKGHLHCLILLGVLCLFFFFSGLGGYGLIDIDETRYVNIARNMYLSGDYVTPYLNFEPFLEKPPMFYWLVVLSYKIFGGISNFASRFPLAFLASLGVFGTYAFTYNIIKSKKAAFLSAVILMSNFWYALFAHIGVLDLGFAVFSAFALFCGVSTLFCKKEWQKKSLWYFGYVFLGLGVLQKGLIGIILPCASLFIIFLALRRVKEIFKPAYIIPGAILFFAICAPWHYLVYKANGALWFNEYILKHHFARFLNSSMDIGRKQGALFYIPIILGGFLPWTIFLIAGAIKAFKCAFYPSKSIKPACPLFTKSRALILINFIWFFVIFLFFSFSSTKLPTYILPAFFPLAILTGYFWRGYIEDCKNKKYIEISSLITILIFLAAGIFGLWYYLSGKINIAFGLAASFALIPFFALYFLVKGKKYALFGAFAALSFSLFAIFSPVIFNFVTSFGQNELEEFSKIASRNQNGELVTYGFARKYSMLNFYREKPVYFISNTENKEEIFKQTLSNLEGAPVYAVIKNKIKYDPVLFEGFETLKKGEKYTLLKTVPNK